MEQPFLSDDDIQELAHELAKGAGISADQARKVLEILHIDWINGNMEGLREIAKGDRDASLGSLPQEAAREVAEGVLNTPVSLDTLRIALKPPGQAGLVV